MNNSSNTWQQALAEAFTDLDSLCHYLQLDPKKLQVLKEYQQFPLKVPRDFANLMTVGDPNDPLLRQVLPLSQELIEQPGFSADPVGDLKALATEGVVHKYQGRLLLISTGACAIHCRYCFRRNFPYGEQQLASSKIQQAIDYIQSRPEITEVILSGGDPLLLNDEKLANLVKALNKIPQLQRIRIHSRIPVVLPSRITPDLLTVFSESRCSIIVVLHSNHPNELSAQVETACQNLKANRVNLLNQSVLLKGINDNAEILHQLSERLFALGVLPYYLHQLDKAKGTAHFEVDDNDALELLEALKQTLPGYLVPKLVREQSGAPYKHNLY